MRKSFLVLLCFLTTQAFSQRTAYLHFPKSQMIGFAGEKLRKALTSAGYSVQLNPRDKTSNGALVVILFDVDSSAWVKAVADTIPTTKNILEPEGFRILRLNKNGSTLLLVAGGDHAGVMYGGLELAERIRIEGVGRILDQTQNPYINRRGVKMNIPLDVRTPSYTDMSDVAQHNIPEMWSIDFWKEYLDSLASYRYNFVSLWSLHPFPSLVKVPEYPNVALNDVHRSKANFKEYYSTRATGFDAPEIVNNYEVVKKISIDEKIKFWREVMQYAKGRNISFYIVTWNIYTNGINGKYGINDDIKNLTTKDYFRKSVKQLFLTYPLLAGIGLTTGENMPGADFQAKENWAFDTYAQGVLDVTKIQPDRKITLIHRQHEAGALDIVKKFSPLIENPNINFVFSFKYAQAHVYSATRQIHHLDFVKQIRETKGLRTLWTLRNDDVYYFRWGSPDFVRDFVKNIPLYVTEGYYYGSDQYIWGREFLDKNATGKRPIELAKHWYQWMLWGRLGYNPNIPNDHFIGILQKRYPDVDARRLFDAWQSASMIYPLTTGFHYGALDFQWYIEGSKSRPEPAQTSSGFHDINRFITLPPYKATDFVSIPDFVAMSARGSSTSGTTPFEVANKISTNADFGLKGVQGISSPGNDELYKIIEDIKSMSYLGKHYSHKINAATHLALYRSDSSAQRLESTVGELNNAAYYWRLFASTALGQYRNPLWMNRVGHVDWRDLYKYVVKDIVDLNGEVRIENMQSKPGGTIIEAEAGDMEGLEEASDIRGYTGSGYVTSDNINDKVTLEYEAEAAGRYVVEFRYCSDNTTAKSRIQINDKQAGEVTLWPGGTSENWVCDKVETSLTEGTHVIAITLPPNIMLDHINIYRR
jgi:hypothetical protein